MVDESRPEEGDAQPRSFSAEPEEGGWDDVHALHDAVMREHERPRDGFEPISVWLIFIFLALVGWGGWYLGTYAGGFRADVIDIIPLEEQAVAPVLEDGEPEAVDAVALGEDVYSNCVPCHQATGQGLAGTFPPLVGNERALGDPRPFAAMLLHGLEGPIEVDGVTYDGVMPGWSRLDDVELAAVMTYVRQAWENDAEPVEPELVGRVRQATADRSEHWTGEQLERFDWQAVEEPADQEDAAAAEEDPAAPEADDDSVDDKE